MADSIKAVEDLTKHIQEAFEFRKRVAWKTYFGSSHERRSKFGNILIELYGQTECTCSKCLDLSSGWGLLDYVKITSKLKSGALQEVKDCKLYAAFKKLCQDHKAPEPDDEQDSPSRHSYGSLDYCLGFGPAGTLREKSWAEKISKLSFSAQIESVYPLLYALDKKLGPLPAQHEPAMFKEWFVTADGVPFLS